MTEDIKGLKSGWQNGETKVMKVEEVYSLVGAKEKVLVRINRTIMGNVL